MSKESGYWENNEPYLEIKIEVVPPEVERILQAIKEYSDPSDIDDPNAGLRFQYRAGLVNQEDLLDLLEDRKKIKYMLDRGILQP